MTSVIEDRGPMQGWTLERVAASVGGYVDAGDAQTQISSVVCDSRDAVPGALFVAIAGERVDGHDFIEAARNLGAAAALTARPVGSPAVVVADPVAALGRLAQVYRESLSDLVVLALTGSSGKTTTKDLLGDILSRVAPTVSPVGSYNSEVGLPLTILRCGPHTRFLVLEMGMRGLGHISYLCEIGQPTAAAVINIGSAHLEMLGSREAIAQAKGEILDKLPESGVAVLFADDPIVMAQATRTSARIMTFGESTNADVRAHDIRKDEQAHSSFTLAWADEQLPVHLNLVGEHQVANACAAATLALAVGVSFSDVVAGLNEAQPRSRWRMEVVTRPDGVTVINDAYNANPESMRVALKTLVALGEGRRTWAVLGEMKELGADSQAEHDALGRLVVRLDVSKLVAVGDGTRALHLGASLEGSWGDESAWVPDVDAAIALLQEQVQPGDVILVKASRSVGLERVAQILLGEVPA
jgi:UDP-N-acetylmuramoyl-tripeptide--D-alanyl-D-alanine ligase